MLNNSSDISVSKEKIFEKKQASDYVTCDIVKKSFNMTNEDIINLCKQGYVKPRKSREGKVYFSNHDIEIISKLKNLHQSSLSVEKEKNNKVLNKIINPNSTISGIETITPKFNLNLKNANTQPYDKNEILNALNNVENSITDKVSKMLSEKLDGLDEVIVELIRCKSENESLRSKIDELNKTNYMLTNKIASYKSIGFGLYIYDNNDK